MYNKLVQKTGENGYESSCASSNNFERLQNPVDDETLEVVDDINAVAANGSATQTCTCICHKNKDANLYLEGIRILRKDLGEQLSLIRAAINTRNDQAENIAHEPVSLALTKTPFAENMEEFNHLEDLLLDRTFRDRVISELRRFKGHGLQASLSYMVQQLVTKELLKQFCYQGSEKTNKLSFKNTRCFDSVKGIYIFLNDFVFLTLFPDLDTIFTCYGETEATMDSIKDKMKNIFRNVK